MICHLIRTTFRIHHWSTNFLCSVPLYPLASVAPSSFILPAPPSSVRHCSRQPRRRPSVVAIGAHGGGPEERGAAVEDRGCRASAAVEGREHPAPLCGLLISRRPSPTILPPRLPCSPLPATAT
uniref:Uncharacterized protein n=1 Tax=Oryza sativa subsp. japonica TaxID=39947 RepID=Q6YXA2_ORYSJ|nr:hypothetical protein [Oryza sativa Japonica Group]